MFEILKLAPVVILAGLMIGGFDALIAAPLATIAAALAASITEKRKFNEILDAALSNVREIVIALFILMLAYAMAEVFMSTGVGAAIINFALKIGITGRSIAVVGVIVTSILSIATGTSWGTFAACAPIFLWLNYIVNGNIFLTIGAIAGGACFGDNIGLISDTTIVSSGIQGVEVIKRVRHQGIWSGLVLLLGVIAFGIAGFILDLPNITGNGAEAIAKIPSDVWSKLALERESAVTLLNQVKQGVPIYMIVPLILVLGAAFRGYQTFICLFIGIISSYILGKVAGTVTDTRSFLENLIMSGFSGAGSWVIVMMMWVSAFGGIMKSIDAFRPLSNLLIKISKNVRQLMFWNGVLAIVGNMTLADEMAQIVTVGPIIRNLVEKNVVGSQEDMEKLKLRNATFNDAMGVFGSQLIPWHVYIGFYIGIATTVYPFYEFKAFDIIKYNFIAYIAVISMLFLTITGFDKFIPNFGLPREPQVTLKKY
ncbi:Na+/H+ antiporter NhaC family protein [Fusobacterium necrogenes]|uniref:Na+/H+ antiporter NhaC family protein n=1 Tax=Fusobacterium necrogenes TaxID=858 RepID=UPI00255CEAA9|nr:Na+/H+ antiporter NhaC family protein [Fusobacterium necrogenes]